MDQILLLPISERGHLESTFGWYKFPHTYQNMTRERFVKTLNTFTVDSLLTVTSIRRKTRWTNISSWSLPFFAPFIWLFLRRTSLLDDHLVLILKVSVVEMVDYIFIQNL